MTVFSPQELLQRHGIAWTSTARPTYTTNCPECGTGYLNVKIERDRVAWFCHHCDRGGREHFEQARRDNKSAKDDELGPIKTIYDYVDEGGTRLFQVLRFEPLNTPKQFRQRTGPEQEKWSIKGVRIVPYRLPELVEDIAQEHTIFIVEGEKDVISLRDRGIPATCNPMGAGKWRDDLGPIFGGADIVICGDNDQPGRDHVLKIARSLKDHAARIRVVDLKAIWPTIEESDDITDWFEAGHTVEELWQHVEQLPTVELAAEGIAEPGQGNGQTASNGEASLRSGPPPRFTLTPFEQITINTRPNYLIKGIIPQGGLTVVWGLPKCGKSFLCFDMAMHIALGRPYRDHRVIQGAVVYMALEGGGGFANRVEAWRQRHVIGGEPVPFHLLAESVDMVADHGKLIDVIRQAAVAPAVIFIDTLNRALVGDENRPDDMARFIRAADALRAAFGCAVVVVHHCGVAGGRPRGHSSLSGADDAQIAIERDKDGIISATIEHAKDSLPGAPFGSRLEVVELGTDDDGDPITSCVVIPAAAGTRAGIRLNANQTRFLHILSQAIAKFPASAVERQGAAEVPDGVPAVTRDVVKKQCLANGWLEEMESGKSRAKVSDMLNALANKKLINLTDRLVWLTSAAGTAGTAGSSPQASPAEKGLSAHVLRRRAGTAGCVFRHPACLRRLRDAHRRRRGAAGNPGCRPDGGGLPGSDQHLCHDELRGGRRRRPGRREQFVPQAADGSRLEARGVRDRLGLHPQIHADEYDR